MNNINGLRADFLFNKLTTYLLHLRNTFSFNSEILVLIVAGLIGLILLAFIRKFFILKQALKVVASEKKHPLLITDPREVYI